MSLPLLLHPAAYGDLDASHDWYEAKRQGLGGEFCACYFLLLQSRFPPQHVMIVLREAMGFVADVLQQPQRE